MNDHVSGHGQPNNIDSVPEIIQEIRGIRPRVDMYQSLLSESLIAPETAYDHIRFDLSILHRAQLFIQDHMRYSIVLDAISHDIDRCAKLISEYKLSMSSSANHARSTQLSPWEQGRRNNILVKRLICIETDRAILDAELRWSKRTADNLQALVEARDDTIENLTIDLAKIEQHGVESRRNFRSLEKKYQRSKRNAHDLQAEQMKLRLDLDDAKKDQAKSDRRTKSIEKKYERSRLDIQNLQATVKSLQTMANNKDEIIGDLKAEIAQLESLLSERDHQIRHLSSTYHYPDDEWDALPPDDRKMIEKQRLALKIGDEPLLEITDARKPIDSEGTTRPSPAAEDNDETTSSTSVDISSADSVPPLPSQKQLDEAQQFFRSFLPPPTNKSTLSPVPPDDHIALNSANLAEAVTIPSIRKRSFGSSVCSIGSESPTSLKSPSSAESISSVPSLKSVHRVNNFKSKMSSMLDDTASTSTVDISDWSHHPMKLFENATKLSPDSSDDLAPDPDALTFTGQASSVSNNGVVLTSDLAPDPSITCASGRSSLPQDSTVVSSDELAPDPSILDNKYNSED